jgi:hypothetical protein
MGIERFFTAGKSNKVQESVQERKRKAKSKQEERELEMQHLKPNKLPPYAGKAPTVDNITKQSVKLVFKSEEDLDKFKNHFHVPKYIEPSVTNIELLMALIDELESGRIKYDKKKQCIQYNLQD